MRFLARNMAWFLRCKEAEEKTGAPASAGAGNLYQLHPMKMAITDPSGAVRNRLLQGRSNVCNFYQQNLFLAPYEVAYIGHLPGKDLAVKILFPVNIGDAVLQLPDGGP